MADFIVAAFLIVIIGAAVIYIVRAKRRGVKCIGCSAGCKGGKSSACHCNFSEIIKVE